MALASVTFRSALTPPVEWSTDELGGGASSGGAAGGGGPSGPGLLVSLLRPSLTITHPFGVVHKAPGGEPGESYLWALPAVLVALLGVVGLAAYGGWRLLRR